MKSVTSTTTTTRQGLLAATQFDSIALSNTFESLPSIFDLPDVPQIDTIMVSKTSQSPLVTSEQLDTLLYDTAVFLKSLRPFPFPTFDDPSEIVRVWISDLILSDTFFTLDPQIKAHSPLVDKVSWAGWQLQLSSNDKMKKDLKAWGFDENSIAVIIKGIGDAKRIERALAMFEMLKLIIEQEKRIVKLKHIVIIAFINALATIFLMVASYRSFRIRSGLYGFLGGLVLATILTFQYAHFMQATIAWLR